MTTLFAPKVRNGQALLLLPGGAAGEEGAGVAEMVGFCSLELIEEAVEQVLLRSGVQTAIP